MSLPPVPPPVGHARGVRGLVFTVLLAVALVVGAGVMAWVLVAVGRPDAVAVGLLFALLPVGPLVACYLWLDRYEPEPRRWLVLAFGWGALVATGTAIALQLLDNAVVDRGLTWSAVVVAPFGEEAGKGLFVLLLVWLRRHTIDGVLDGLVYAGLVGVGFAFTENILYFSGAYSGDLGPGTGGLGSATALFIVRGVFSPFAHPLFTSMVGIGAGIMVITRRRWLKVLAPMVGYLLAVGLHAGWNGSAFAGDGVFFLLTYVFAMVPGFFALAGLAIWFRVREGRMLQRSLGDLAHRGYLDAAEVPWLVRPSARRLARRNARRRGGTAAERTLKEYQRQAVELAVLHDRLMRGSGPADAQQRGHAMAQRLHALHDHVVPSRTPVRVAEPAWGTRPM